MGLKGIAYQAKVDGSVAVEFDQAMRSKFPRLVQWRDEVREQTRAGDSLDNGLGASCEAEPDQAHTQAPALMGQSTARDLMAEGILGLPRDIVPLIRAFVHDEIVLSVPIARRRRDRARKSSTLSSSSGPPPHASNPVEITAGLSQRGRDWADVYRKGA